MGQLLPMLCWQPTNTFTQQHRCAIHQYIHVSRALPPPFPPPKKPTYLCVGELAVLCLKCLKDSFNGIHAAGVKEQVKKVDSVGVEANLLGNGCQHLLLLVLEHHRVDQKLHDIGAVLEHALECIHVSVHCLQCVGLLCQVNQSVGVGCTHLILASLLCGWRSAVVSLYY